MPKTLKDKRIHLHEHLNVKKEKTLDLEVYAPKVKDLIAELDDIPIAELRYKDINIKKITLIGADREKLLEQTNNPGIELEIIVAPGPR